MLDDSIRVGDLFEGMPLMALLPARRAFAALTQDFGFGLFSPSDDGGLLEFRLLIASRASSSVTFN